MFDVDPGGTAMDEGIALAMSELERMAGQPGTISQMVVLTDGETSGEQNCKVLAKKATEKKINLSLMGVGTDWKEELIKDLANISNGKWYYIDVNQEKEAERVFLKEFQALAATGFTDVEMNLRPMKDIKLKRVRMVVPEVKDLKLEEPEERKLVAKLGALQHDQPTRFIVDLTVPKRPDGKFVIAQVEITYDAGTGQRESSGQFPLEITYTAAGHGYVNAEVMKHIDDIQFKEMSQNLEKALADNNTEAAKQVAQQMEKKGELMGKRAAKKTMLAKQVLDELNVGGRVSKKTMLASADESRQASEG
jgi:Ca-activated chloride channel family protein